MCFVWFGHIWCSHDNVHCRLQGLGTHQIENETDVSSHHTLACLSIMLYRWPLFFDNTVAGGIPYGLTPFESLVKECAEEANLEQAFVELHAKSCGSISYFHR